MNGIKSLIFLTIYYGFAQYLPPSYNRVFGRLSKWLRYQCCRRLFKECGCNVNVERKAYFGTGSMICIGDNSGLGINCVIPNGSIIGKDVMMGPNCFIHSTNHNFDRVDIPMNQKGETEALPVIIGDDVWIGQSVTIMRGRKIESGSIIPANCVLTKDFPPYSVVGGNPSNLIKTRK